jgi:hypothetical protein
VPAKQKKVKKGGTVNRVGDAVTPSRRDPDIGKMIKEVKVPKKLKSGGMAKKGKGC